MPTNTDLAGISEIAFDASHRNAVFQFSYSCGGLCGHGAALVFEKINGHWKTTNRPCSRWIA